MPKFDTPEPITVSIDMIVGAVRVRAEARTDTTVEVRPRDANRDMDVQAAEQAQVDYTAGRLRIHVPRNRLRELVSSGPAVDIDVNVPEGSELDTSGYATYVCEGRLGRVDIQGSLGVVRIDHTGPLRVRNSAGDILVGRADGPVDLHTATGKIQIGTIDGSGEIRSSTGELHVGDVTGDLRLKTAYGDITVERGSASVDAKTAYGAIRVAEVGGGTVGLQTGFGELEIGVPEDLAAYLNLKAKAGRVRSELDAAGTPADTDKKVEIHARTAFGDILVRRA